MNSDERQARENKISTGYLPACGPRCGLANASRRVHSHDNECVYRDPDKELIGMLRPVPE